MFSLDRHQRRSHKFALFALELALILPLKFAPHVSTTRMARPPPCGRLMYLFTSGHWAGCTSQEPRTCRCCALVSWRSSSSSLPSSSDGQDRLVAKLRGAADVERGQKQENGYEIASRHAWNADPIMEAEVPSVSLLCAPVCRALDAKLPRNGAHWAAV